MESQVYPDALSSVGLDWVIPDPADRETIDQIIMNELVLGRIEDTSREHLKKILSGLIHRGADSAFLVCTELPLILKQAQVPLLDSTRLLARAAVDHALGDKA